jgi:hypothetical protein
MRVNIDLNGRKVSLDEGVLRAVCARAAAFSGESSQLNDLAVLLKNALSEHRPLTLQRAEARTFRRLLKEQQEGNDALRDRLPRA